MRICVVALLLTLVASVAFAQTCSANGRFCLHREWSEDDTQPRAIFTVSDELFAPGKVVGRFALKDPVGEALVSDDGRFIVFVLDIFRGVSITIRHSDGAIVATIPISDLLTEHDIELAYAQESRWSLDGDRLVLSVLTSPNPKIETRANVEVDLRNGRVLTAKRDLIEPLLPTIRQASAKTEKPWGEPRCVDGATVTFATAGLHNVDSAIFLSSAVDTPFAEYPSIARKAHVSGTVRVEALVDETGAVTCVRTTRLPFGLDESARQSVLRWQFRRIRTGATIAPVRGMFELVYELGRVSPPLTIQ
jgi:TonB family protein